MKIHVVNKVLVLGQTLSNIYETYVKVVFNFLLSIGSIFLLCSIIPLKCPQLTQRHFITFQSEWGTLLFGTPLE